jgi:hypothetical protein
VFISHTDEMRSFPADRSFLAAAEAAVLRAGDVVSDLAYFPAQSTPPVEVISQAVRDADIYVGIIGFRYGALIPDRSMSYLEYEFQTARKTGIPTLIFMLADDAIVPVSMITAADPESIQRQLDLRRRVAETRIIGQFATPDELETELLHVLVQLENEISRVERQSRRSVMILCSSQQRDLGVLLARELAPDASVLVHPADLGASTTERLLSQLKDVDVALVLPSDVVAGLEWFEIGAVVGALGAERTIIVSTENNAQLKLPTLIFRPEEDSAEVVRNAAAMVRSLLPITESRGKTQPAFYSCFLSYSHADSDFVGRLYQDLQDAGISCWLDSTDIRIGAPWRQELHHRLAGHDKVLLILSQHSMASNWVRTEFRLATELESQRNRAVLFPIRIDNSIFTTSQAWTADLLRNHQIGDFTRWDDEARYRQSLRRLVQDLTISAAGGTAHTDAP